MSNTSSSPLRRSILRKIDTHLVATGQALGAFGIACLNDHKVVPQLRAGKNITLWRLEAMLEYIDVIARLGEQDAEADEDRKAA
jgi:hypothetical protein